MVAILELICSVSIVSAWCLAAASHSAAVCADAWADSLYPLALVSCDDALDSCIAALFLDASAAVADALAFDAEVLASLAEEAAALSEALAARSDADALCAEALALSTFWLSSCCLFSKVFTISWLFSAASLVASITSMASEMSPVRVLTSFSGIVSSKPSL